MIYTSSGEMSEASDSIDHWLTSIKMERYVDNFKQAGLTSMDKVVQMTLKDLIAIGVTLIGHQKKIINSIQALHAQVHGARSTDGCFVWRNVLGAFKSRSLHRIEPLDAYFVDRRTEVCSFWSSFSWDICTLQLWAVDHISANHRLRTKKSKPELPRLCSTTMQMQGRRRGWKDGRVQVVMN